MSNLHVKFVLIGGGLASSSAAKAIRAVDAQADIMLVGQEIHRPYHRPPLSQEFLRHEKTKTDLFAEAGDWYLANHVQLRTGRRAAHVDATRDSVTLDSGEEISFDKLLIATGSTPNSLLVPGANLPNLFYLRTIEDAEHLHNAIDKARREAQARKAGHGRVTVIGGGLLGVELAGSFVAAGLAVDLVLSGKFPWNHFAGEAAGRMMNLFLEGKGIHIHAGDRAQRLEGDGRVQRVILNSGKSIACDFAVAAVGTHVNKDLLRGSPIVAEKAIVVDSKCRTSHENIFAAGDCAAILDPLFGKHRLMSQWDSAASTGTIAGTNMAGGNGAYDRVGSFQTKVLGLSAKVWGEGRLVDRRLIRGNAKPDAPDFVEIGIAADGRIAQVIAVGHSNEDPVLEALVARRLPVNGNQEMLKDPAFPLEHALKK
jgi:3-phenylpropionate/trans-cinnamate dioxygenase ferredoxin reductase subunit